MFDPYYKWLGIPPKDQPPDHYRLLGIDLFESDPDVIDAAANRLMAYLQGCATGPQVALSQKLLNECCCQYAGNKSGPVASPGKFTLRSHRSQQSHAQGRFVLRPAQGLLALDRNGTPMQPNAIKVQVHLMR
jgi:hypothetical protein